MRLCTAPKREGRSVRVGRSSAPLVDAAARLAGAGHPAAPPQQAPSGEQQGQPGPRDLKGRPFIEPTQVVATTSAPVLDARAWQPSPWSTASCARSPWTDSGARAVTSSAGTSRTRDRSFSSAARPDSPSASRSRRTWLEQVDWRPPCTSPRERSSYARPRCAAAVATVLSSTASACTFCTITAPSARSNNVTWIQLASSVDHQRSPAASG